MGGISEINKIYGEMIVHDEYMKSIANDIESVCQEIENMYADYVNIMKGIRDNAIIEGDTHEAIAAFVELLEMSKGQMEMSGRNMKLIIDDFVYQVDKKDKYLY